MVATTASTSTSTAPLPSTFSRAQAKKAVDALLAHNAKVTAEREDTELLSREEYINLVINTKRGSTKRKVMPQRIQLPNPPLPPPPATTVAIITKPPQRTYKDLLSSSEHNIKFINRVVDTDKLRGKWRPFEARRNLMRENDLWLADERVIPSLPKLLGKKFYEAKKVPIPVNLQRKDLKAELGRAINSTYFHPSTGTSHSVRIATAGHSTASQTLDNLLAALPLVIAQIPEGWENVLSVGIKTSSSLLLPVWASKLDGRFDIPTKDGDVDMAEGKTTTKSKSGGKEKEGGKKRAAAPTEVEEPKKAKKAVTKETAAVEKLVEKVAKAGEKKVAAGKAKKDVKKDVKKSSGVGSGGAGKRSKEAALGRSK